MANDAYQTYDAYKIYDGYQTYDAYQTYDTYQIYDAKKIMTHTKFMTYRTILYSAYRTIQCIQDNTVYVGTDVTEQCMLGQYSAAILRCIVRSHAILTVHTYINCHPTAHTQ